DILAFHLNDADPSALIDADLERLSFMNDHGIFTNKDKLYEDALKSIETLYSDSPASAQAMYLRAQLYHARGQEYDPFLKKENQFEIKKAKELCEQVIGKFPGSEGAINCQNLLTTIKQPTLNVEAEKVNQPGQLFRSLVKYKNVQKLYLRIIKISREEI